MDETRPALKGLRYTNHHPCLARGKNVSRKPWEIQVWRCIMPPPPRKLNCSPAKYYLRSEAHLRADIPGLVAGRRKLKGSEHKINAVPPLLTPGGASVPIPPATQL
ncbi:hypothetical protein E2C01_038868 [Portunus trituberculatus]|uniref:Uncharacterized protein n=1 Tax=Portunus trituberculatus TaxID=210409 RepID=A0A5B7FJN8_PORTR|nr:hypothetical protein [Portunus trituberculatus]